MLKTLAAGDNWTFQDTRATSSEWKFSSSNLWYCLRGSFPHAKEIAAVILQSQWSLLPLGGRVSPFYLKINWRLRDLGGESVLECPRGNNKLSKRVQPVCIPVSRQSLSVVPPGLWCYSRFSQGVGLLGQVDVSPFLCPKPSRSGSAAVAVSSPPEHEHLPSRVKHYYHFHPQEQFSSPRLGSLSH